jgi:choline-sulfatase
MRSAISEPRRRGVPALSAALALAALSTGLACRAPQESLPPRRVELAALAPQAQLVAESRRFDLGEPGARPALWSGWGSDERNRDLSFVWGMGESSRLVVHLGEPRQRQLELRGWSFPFADGQAQRVTLSVNGDEVGEADLDMAPERLAFEVDADHWRRGENVVDIRYARAQRHAADGLQRAAGWDWIAVAPGEPSSPPAFDPESGKLRLPGGSAASWSLELPENSWLVWEGLETTGGARLRAEVWSESDRSDLRVVSLGRSGRLRLTRRVGAARVTGLTLRALGEQGAVVVGAARLRLPEPAAPPPAAGLALPRRPNLIVYLVDTLRADHLGCYGYDRPTSPEIDRFARGAALFENGRAQASWTRPAVATLLTGLYPISHGAEEKYTRIPDEVVTLAERLAAAGYETAMFTTNANVAGRFGFDQGFETFRYLTRRSGGHRAHLDSAEINRHVFDWLARRDPSRPFFLVVHTLDPHDPYQPSEPFLSRLAPGVDVATFCCAATGSLAGLSTAEAERHRAGAMALYDAEIAENDASFGALLGELDRRELGASTAVLLTADHGEEFFEHHGWKHGFTLYEEMLRVPFVLRLPGGVGGGRRLHGPMQQVDVAPTLLALAGLASSPELPGRNVLPDVAGTAAPELTSLAWLERPGLELRSAVRSGWKLVERRGEWQPPAGRPPYELYQLGSDPGERVDRALWRPLPRLWLRGELAAAVLRFHSARPVETVRPDPEIEKSLRALGYL